MSEFTFGIFNAIKTLIKGSSLDQAIIYTLGHIVIAWAPVSIMTVLVYEAGAVALIEPTINGIWFYFLHTTWKKMTG